MGFSALGLAVAVLVLAPNLLLLRLPPRDGYPPGRVPLPLTVTERAGQALCLATAVIVEPGALHWWWALPAVVALLGYFLLWARHLATGRRVRALYEPVLGVPVPMAILPVVTFLCAGAWLSNGWLIASAVVLAAGHIPASVILARSTAPRGFSPQ